MPDGAVIPRWRSRRPWSPRDGSGSSETGHVLIRDCRVTRCRVPLWLSSKPVDSALPTSARAVGGRSSSCTASSATTGSGDVSASWPTSTPSSPGTRRPSWVETRSRFEPLLRFLAAWHRTVTCRIADGLIVHASYVNGDQALADRVLSNWRPGTQTRIRKDTSLRRFGT